jgi:hypothetical protein
MPLEDVEPASELRPVFPPRLPTAHELASRRERTKSFALQISNRRNRLKLILTDEHQPWPPPPELTPWATPPRREVPNRDDVRRVLKLRSRNGKHGLHHVAGQARLSWRAVKWIADVFES